MLLVLLLLKIHVNAYEDLLLHTHKIYENEEEKRHSTWFPLRASSAASGRMR